MSKVRSDPNDYSWAAPPHIVVHALHSNKKPIGYAPWPEPPKKKRRRKKK